jgi:acyl-CoA hydrolase
MRVKAVRTWIDIKNMTILPAPKTPHASRISIAQLMQPEHANIIGHVHGGWIMKLVDEAGALACMRHAQKRVVTVALDSMVFREPIKIGDLVTGERTDTNTAYLVYVALDNDGSPTPVPALITETDDEKQRMELAKKRQAHRIAQK